MAAQFDFKGCELVERTEHHNLARVKFDVSVAWQVQRQVEHDLYAEVKEVLGGSPKGNVVEVSLSAECQQIPQVTEIEIQEAVKGYYKDVAPFMLS